MTNSAEEAIRKILPGFISLISSAQKSVPFTSIDRPVFHFTGEDALTKGILQERVLRAYLVTEYEDEVKYSLERAGEIISLDKLNTRNPWLKELLPLLDVKKKHAINKLGLKQYIVCFSRTEDEPEHWKKYGRAGRGFAIALGFSSCVNRENHTDSPLLPIQVLYDPRAQDELIMRFLQSSDTFYCRLLVEQPALVALVGEEVLRQTVIRWTALGVWTLALALKDNKYHTENELRLVRTVADFVDGSEGVDEKTDSRHKHFVELRYSTLPIVELVRGIYAPYSNEDKKLKQLLYNATGSEVRIRRSTIYPG